MSAAATPAAAARVPARDDYADFCAGVRRLCGIDLSQYKRGQMERRTRTFAERREHGTLDALLRAMSADAAELEAFLDRMTINVSQLWRNPEQWRLLARAVLPGLADRPRVRAWSAGCSYGAEAYTLAAVLRDTLGPVDAQITGTDIDERMVRRARAGAFSADDARDAPRDAVRRWFSERDGELHAAEELRRMCRFGTGDLLRIEPPAGAYDLVFCRNTVIYFEAPVRDALHARLAAAVRPGGHLVIGSTERVSAPAELGLVPAHPFVYRKR
jgi:chemotaxis protein methyltransferase CheR